MDKMMSLAGVVMYAIVVLTTVFTVMFAMRVSADDAPVNADCHSNQTGCAVVDPENVTVLPAITVESDTGVFLSYERMVDLLDAPSEMIRSGLSVFSRSVDEFFANEKLDYDKSGSYVRLTTDAAWFQSEASGFGADLRLRLKLPRTSEKYKFTLETSPERTKDELDNVVESDVVNAADNQAYFAGLQAVYGAKDRLRFRTGFGVKLRTPIDSYVRLDSWRDFVFEPWSLHVQGSSFWFRHDGRKLLSTIEISKLLAEDLLFRATARTHWAELEEFLETSQVLSLYKTLNAERQLSLQAGVYGVTEPVIHATDYRVSAGIRKYLRKRYLFIELIPQLRYQKIHHFTAERGVVLRLEWVFSG